jgi:hypothetical protein
MPRSKSNPVAERLAAGGYYRPTEAENPQGVEAPSGQDALEAKKVKKTVYLSQDVDLLLTQLQLDQQRETGVRPDRSDLVEEGILLLYAKRQAAETA